MSGLIKNEKDDTSFINNDINKIENEQNKEINQENLVEKNEKEKKYFKKTKKNTVVSSYSPAYITEPIYQWEVSNKDRIFYDKTNDYIIHQNSATKALLVTDIKKSKDNYNGVYVKFDKDLCEHICFSINGSFFLYYTINPNRIEISDILNNHNIYLNVEINKLNEYKILSAFWINDLNKKTNITSSYFVVVTNNSIEIFQITFDNLVITPVKKHYIKSQYCWYDENSSYVILLSNKNNILLPYLISNNNAIKLPKIELNIIKAEKINENDIQIINLYNETYCIHKDHKNGRISFRCLSSAIYFDYVLDIFYNGLIDIFCIDNLLIVFNNSNEKVYLFDIQYNNQNKVTNYISNTNYDHTVNISYLTNPKPFKTDINFNNITFKSFNILIDNHLGNLYKIKIDYDLLMLQICQHFSNLNISVDILLRRPNCKNRIIEMIYLSLENDIKIEDFISMVNIINKNYRKLIEEAAKKNAKNTTKTHKKVTQLLNNLLKNFDSNTITEKDFVINIFHPYIIKQYNLKKKETLFNFSINFREIEKNKKIKRMNMLNKNNEKYMLKYKIKKDYNEDFLNKQKIENLYIEEEKKNIKENEIEEIINIKDNEIEETININENEIEETINIKENEIEEKTNIKENEIKETININNNNQIVTSSDNLYNDYNINLKYINFQNIPLFLIYVFEYMKSLLYLNIIPNRILQTFIFDLCVFFKQDNCLRQLLQYYVISDSIEITKRLFHFWKLTKYKWAFQNCLDMSLRLKEYEMIIHLFLSSQEYIKVMKFLRKYNLIDYPITLIFQTIEHDFNLPNKCVILNYVIQSLNNWIIDIQNNSEKITLNLQNCEKWIKLVEV